MCPPPKVKAAPPVTQAPPIEPAEVELGSEKSNQKRTRGVKGRDQFRTGLNAPRTGNGLSIPQ